ncbi:uncharacterized protein METZ01_LOCUS322711 [marine metagenome]|uniref:Uncharacterized protein n=1 Tax=marine metagenome TaxID=408172 RepID=A0A382PAI5_9ZZZZ
MGYLALIAECNSSLIISQDLSLIEINLIILSTSLLNMKNSISLSSWKTSM